MNETIKRNRKPDISIIVPVYNVEKYLPQCMSSIMNQTYRNLEIICIDDGSTDGSGDILERCAQDDGRIKVVHKANAGVGAAMNDGLRMAVGNYIGIVESDDYAERNMFETLLRIACREEADYVRSDFWLVSDEGRMPKNLFRGVGIETGKVFSERENMNKLNYKFL